MFHRIYIRKRPAFRHLPFSLSKLCAQLNLPALKQLETIAIYDLYGCPEHALPQAITDVFSDPVSDEVIEELPSSDDILVIEPLPGQFDQRADAAEQCLRLLNSAFAATKVCTATAWLISGTLDAAARDRLKNYLLNPIESREKDLKITALPEIQLPPPVPRYKTFSQMGTAALDAWRHSQGLAMSLADLQLVQHYFQQKKRVPSETEIRVLDTYWSDHCRHTTFTTELTNIQFPSSAFGKAMQQDYEDVLAKRRVVYGADAEKRPMTLMDLATIDAKYQRKQGNLVDVEVSAEVNACSVFVDVYENNQRRPWLLQFKNETHNHPTEIEPFGGASTCIGGAIRDPLSGRAYVYQALRLSGCADPREAITDTLTGKLPQIVIAQRAAAGASSYGNQIGLATGQVVEIYHAGYKAKHLEVGAVVAAAPAEHVRRETPKAGDIVVLLGGATGRDGCGGATGSSREHNRDSLTQSAAEVQKGNAPEERKLQRLFRQAAFAQKVKRCNDFGAGGVCVAVGEIASSLDINLDAVPVKYQGLSATELAISESQERMAIVIAAEDFAAISDLAAKENLSACKIAQVTDSGKMIMRYRGEVVVELDRAFLDSNGAVNQQNSVVLTDAKCSPKKEHYSWKNRFQNQLTTLAHSDLRGLGDRFDFSVGASCVLLPYGGKYHATPAEASAYLLPTETPTDTTSLLAYGFNPELSSHHPYLGGMAAVMEASAKIIACGGNIRQTHFSLQEYFPKLGNDGTRWGAPFAALLGAHHALSALNRAAIGGKDSMSGSFQSLDVPPTLIAFAVNAISAQQILSPEFKAAEEYVYWLRCPADELGRPNCALLLEHNDFINELNHAGLLTALRSVRHGGVLQAIYEAMLGNRIGCGMAALPQDAFEAEYGSFLLTSQQPLPDRLHLHYLGMTLAEAHLSINHELLSLDELQQKQQSLSAIYPLNSKEPQNDAPIPAVSVQKAPVVLKQRCAQPRVCLPAFYGTNSELDTGRAFVRAGGSVSEVVICNRHQQDIDDSVQRFVRTLENSQILALSGGFSVGDEPDGSGKFIANTLRQPQIADAIEAFLQRDGLILGICNGFQALIKCGLLPYGKLQQRAPNDPTLTHNHIQRHIARIVTTVISNNHSPWLQDFKVGSCHDIAISHGEGLFWAESSVLQTLSANGQIATQYANPDTGKASLLPIYNPNGSHWAIEGITSPCGRILGKMGHSERYQAGIYRNHPNFRPQNIFAAGIKAFS